MRLKVDENLPQQVATILRPLGFDVLTVHDQRLDGCSDHQLWRASRVEERVLLTQDLDFSDQRVFEPGTHAGIVLVRLRTPSRYRLLERIGEVFRQETVTSWTGCFVVVTDHKIRVRRPLASS